MSTTENMENIPEKMECSEGLNINEILAEAKRKLLKYQRKKWSTEQEDLKERFISDGDEKCSSLIGRKKARAGESPKLRG